MDLWVIAGIGGAVLPILISIHWTLIQLRNDVQENTRAVRRASQQTSGSEPFSAL